MPSDLSNCADLASLGSPMPPPVDAMARARVTALRSQLDHVRALAGAAKYADALAQANAVHTDAETLGYRPLLAESDFALGSLKRRTDDMVGAEHSFEQASLAAQASSHDELEARAWINLVEVVGNGESRFDDAEHLLARATAAVERRGNPARLRMELLHSTGDLRLNQGRHKEALAAFEESTTLNIDVLGENAPQVAVEINAAGTELETMGDYAGARQHYERARELQSRILGPDHPDVARTLLNLGVLAAITEHYDDALALDQQALTIVTKVFGEEHERVAEVENELGIIYMRRGQHPDAMEHYQRAVAIATKVLGARHLEESRRRICASRVRSSTRGTPAHWLLQGDVLGLAMQYGDSVGIPWVTVMGDTSCAVGTFQLHG